jgi:hypothetical protein
MVHCAKYEFYDSQHCGLYTGTKALDTSKSTGGIYSYVTGDGFTILQDTEENIFKPLLCRELYPLFYN